MPFQKGQQNPKYKLDDDARAEIEEKLEEAARLRDRLHGELSRRAIALAAGVSIHTVNSIARGVR